MTRKNLNAQVDTQVDAEAPQAPHNSQASTARESAAPHVRLVPYEDNARPALANYTNIEIGSAMVYLDFGFIEPRLVNVLQSAMVNGQTAPEQVNGRLAARVAVGFDVLQVLQRQIQVTVDGMNRIAQKQIAAYANATPAASPAADMADASRSH